MSNIFQNIKEKKAAEIKAQEEAQRARIERLQELEKGTKKQGFHIPNPVKAVKEKKEIKNLQKEIAAYEEKKRTKKILIVCVGMFVGLMIFVSVMAALENAPRKSDYQITDSETNTIHEQISNEDIDTTETIENQTEETKSTEIVESEELLDGENIVEQEESASKIETELEETDSVTLSLTAGDLNVSTITDYAHTDTDAVFLGTNEGVTITISSSKADLSMDNILLIYDEDLISAKVQEETDGNHDCMKVYLKTKSVCETYFFICTVEEFETYGEESDGYYLEIRQMDSKEGRVVYVTATGEKYHYSESCAGDNATKTTRKDAEGYAYTPCGKCAN